jgi:ABC-type amino acid transport substrate-binding protein
MVLSSWHFRSLSKEYSLQPLLVATRKGEFSFKKLLSVKKSVQRIEDLAGKVVASAGSVEHTQNLLLKMFGKDNADLLLSIKILSVPKDIDALLAVSYNVAQAAITTRESLDLVEVINPKLKEKLYVLMTSDNILMPVAAVKKPFMIEETQKIIKIMKEMKTRENGRENLSALSVDGWVDVSPEMIETLKK